MRPEAPAFYNGCKSLISHLTELINPAVRRQAKTREVMRRTADYCSAFLSWPTIS
jgi:hypothetical protein